MVKTEYPNCIFRGFLPSLVSDTQTVDEMTPNKIKQEYWETPSTIT